MSALGRKIMLLTFFMVSCGLLSGCTSLKKKYAALNVEHQNLKGLYDNCKSTLDSSASEKENLAAKLAEGEQTIEELRKQMETKGQTAGQATGFGDNQVEVNAAAGTITVTLPNAILFDSGKDSLKSSAKKNLSEIVSVLNEKYSGRLLDIVGHTDTDPIKKSNWKDNWQLSTERALTVLRQLVSNGIPENQIRAVGCGSSLPVADNSSASGKAKNRRVELVVHMK
ncbi:MAG: OmpA family protein [Phycisphaerae bacterium]|jgi:chemotaxis protein MotB